MSSIAANMEWLFTEAGDSTACGIRAAAAHGLDALEIWGWRDKNIEDIRAALRETRVTLLSLVVDPQLQIPTPPPTTSTSSECASRSTPLNS